MKNSVVIPKSRSKQSSSDYPINLPNISSYDNFLLESFRSPLAPRSQVSSQLPSEKHPENSFFGSVSPQPPGSPAPEPTTTSTTLPAITPVPAPPLGPRGLFSHKTASPHAPDTGEPRMAATRRFLEISIAKVCEQHGLLVLFKHRMLGARLILDATITSLPHVVLTVSEDAVISFNSEGSRIVCKHPYSEFRILFDQHLISLLQEPDADPLFADEASDSSHSLELAPLCVTSPVQQEQDPSVRLRELQCEAKNIIHTLKRSLEKGGFDTRFREDVVGYRDSFSAQETSLQITLKVTKGCTVSQKFLLVLTASGYTFSTDHGVFTTAQGVRQFEVSVLNILDQVLRTKRRRDLLKVGQCGPEYSLPVHSDLTSPSVSFSLSSPSHSCPSSPSMSSFSLRSPPLSSHDFSSAGEACDELYKLYATVARLASASGMYVEIKTHVQDAESLLYVLAMPRATPLFDIKIQDSMYVLFKDCQRVFVSFVFNEFLAGVKRFVRALFAAF
eukprot:gnl/Chilomastix_cuspidata/717.p1 GENE.gnl/Chilomastix_cuspidata/717~~gnl/Chilomastix_cuspidata/717.p1  ORF type:complete len:503 (-),score=191.08 gnl/Chilomastix_cuspidata/717:297-1805(-)